MITPNPTPTPVDGSPTSKPFYQSKTFWGTILGLVPTIAHAAGYALNPAVASIVQTLAAVFAVYGRAKATQPISIK